MYVFPSDRSSKEPQSGREVAPGRQMHQAPETDEVTVKFLCLRLMWCYFPPLELSRIYRVVQSVELFPTNLWVASHFWQ